MNRRGFLAAIAGSLVLDPERLLWRPGEKLISIPKPLNDADAALLSAYDAAFARFEGVQVRAWHRYTGGQVTFDEYLKCSFRFSQEAHTCGVLWHQNVLKCCVSVKKRAENGR